MKDTILPERLRPGGTIGIVSPSAAVVPGLRPQLDSGIDALERLGYSTKLGKNALLNHQESAGTPRQRADDINSMFADSSVDAIICTQGGDTSNMCLPYIDFDIIRENPKIFMGISDITALLNAFHARTGMVTFHGNDVMWGFGRKMTGYDISEFTGRLSEARGGTVEKNSVWKTVRGGIGEGRLLGGNLRCLLKLAGTPYMPDLTDSILFLEAFEMTPEICGYLLGQLGQTGAFERLRGVLIGYIWGLQSSAERRKLARMEEMLVELSESYSFPVVKCDDFGHNCPNTVLPVGAMARISADGGEPCLDITAPFLR